jgi:hypothetical protein
VLHALFIDEHFESPCKSAHGAEETGGCIFFLAVKASE